MGNLFPNPGTELKTLRQHREHHSGIVHGQQLEMAIIREQ